ncbi:MAG: zinc metalloprotease HtpX [Candidatus Moraniibacteriota bacterium]|nr:MAG: zinc metalloprotease HtpX [Candidatus Moranbacteria bacterium]
MATAYTHSSKNVGLTWLYLSVFLVVVIGIGYLFAQIYGNSAILYGVVLFSTLTSFVSYWWSDRIVLSMANAKPVERETNPELYSLVENLAITTGMPVPKIYIAEDGALNAFATGRNPEHGVICFTTGILARLNRAELEGVAAHELSHIKNRDTLVSTVVVILAGFITILADMFQHSFLFRSRDNDNKGGALIIVGLVLAILAPIAALLIRMAISRKRELLADASGALMTRYPEGLASALEKISGDPQPVATASDATAHLYISNPFKGRHLSKLFMTHPPVEERVAALRDMDLH